MALRSKLSILVVHGRFLARADFVGGARAALVELWREPREVGDEPLELSVERAARLGGALRGAVWVLTDDVLLFNAELDARTLRGVSDEELGRALAIEAQVQSGMAVEESAVQWRRGPIEGQRQSFALAQLALDDLEAVTRTVHELGGRLRGLGHPAGVPLPLGTGRAPEEPFVRREEWGATRVVVARAERDGLQLSIASSSDPTFESPDQGAPDEFLILDGSGAAAGAEVLDLADDAHLAQWLTAWARVLAERAARSVLPLLPPPVAPPSATRSALLAAGLSIVVLMVAIQDHGRLDRRRAELVRELGQLQGQIDLAARNRASLAALDRDLEQAERLARVPTAQPIRWDTNLAEEVLTTLATRRPEGVFVHSLVLDWRRSTIDGLALEPSAADVLATRLALALEDYGYDVFVASKLVEERFTDFEIVVERPRVRRALVGTADAELGG